MRLLGWERNDRARGNSYSPPDGKAEPIEDRGVALLVITRDPELYARMWDIASKWKWTISQATEVSPSAAAICFDSASIRIVIYDGDSLDGEWMNVLGKINQWEGYPCVLLASRVSDQYLWDEVVRCGGYDVIVKSAEESQLMRTLRFAWFWKKILRPQWNDNNKPGSNK
jgi:hypothetical protein